MDWQADENKLHGGTATTNPKAHILGPEPQKPDEFLGLGLEETRDSNICDILSSEMRASMPHQSLETSFAADIVPRPQLDVKAASIIARGPENLEHLLRSPKQV